MTAPDLALAETDPAGFVLAVAELRKQRTQGAAGGRQWVVDFDGWGDPTLWTRSGPDDPHPVPVLRDYDVDRAAPGAFACLVAEGNPAHTLAEVALWLGIVERHGPGLGKFGWCDTCGKLNGSVPYPCPDLLAVVAAAKAYLVGAS